MAPAQGRPRALLHPRGSPPSRAPAFVQAAAGGWQRAGCGPSTEDQGSLALGPPRGQLLKNLPREEAGVAAGPSSSPAPGPKKGEKLSFPREPCTRNSSLSLLPHTAVPVPPATVKAFAWAQQAPAAAFITNLFVHERI